MLLVRNAENACKILENSFTFSVLVKKEGDMHGPEGMALLDIIIGTYTFSHDQ